MKHSSLELETTLILRPRVEECGPLVVAGLRGRFDPATLGGIPRQWQRFASYLGNIPGQIGRITYGLCFQLRKGIEYVSGVEVSRGVDLPVELSRIRIPAQRYLIFTHPGHVSQLRATLDAIWHKHLAVTGHHPARAGAGAPDFFERYGERFDPETGTGDIEIWIPIEK